jgi:hypothetical protein
MGEREKQRRKKRGNAAKKRPCSKGDLPLSLPFL